MLKCEMLCCSPSQFPGGFPGSQQDPLYGYFSAVAGQDGHVSAEELQACLTQANFSGGYKPFNLETCRLMIGMLDRDMSGSMGFNEFKELWTVINAWKQHFMAMDRDRSGTVDPQEMNQALSSMGYRLSPQAMNCIIKRYSCQGKITFDDYVACCVRLRSLTGKRNVNLLVRELLLQPTLCARHAYKSVKRKSLF
uniref:Sorcin n=1 Tax=Electrophorus electricus TaxID=8005 RepID=A0AAY5E8Y8_ELEEL